MKKTLVASLILLMVPAFAVAEGVPIIEDHFKTDVVYEPYIVRVCDNRVVGGDKTMDTVRGAIIGGAIGNAITKDTEGTAAGIILGGLIGHDKSDNIPTIKNVCTNETRYDEYERTIYSHSTITFEHEGRRRTLTFIK